MYWPIIRNHFKTHFKRKVHRSGEFPAEIDRWCGKVLLEHLNKISHDRFTEVEMDDFGRTQPLSSTAHFHASAVLKANRRHLSQACHLLE